MKRIAEKSRGTRLDAEPRNVSLKISNNRNVQASPDLKAVSKKAESRNQGGLRAHVASRGLDALSGYGPLGQHIRLVIFGAS